MSGYKSDQELIELAYLDGKQEYNRLRDYKSEEYNLYDEVLEPILWEAFNEGFMDAYYREVENED